MRILALVLARGGSKRLPNKNILDLGGRPLIEWSIKTAQAFPEICDVLVSTDDCVIADVAAKAGGLVPWYRPAELSSDTATSVDAALHAIDWYESQYGELDGVLLLQPTSPFRRKHTVRRGIDLFMQNRGRAVIGIANARTHPLWALKITEDGSLKPWLDEGGLNLRSQDLPPAYTVTGAFYLATPKEVRLHKSFFIPNAMPLFPEGLEETLDIDTEEDFLIAQAFLSTRSDLCVEKVTN